MALHPAFSLRNSRHTMLQSTQAVVNKSTSTKYEDHTGLLHKLAARGWGRLEGAGVPTAYDDGGGSDAYEFISCAMDDDTDESAEERLEARQESHRAARMLSPNAKRVIA